MKRFYTVTLFLLALLYAGCAVTGSNLYLAGAFWGILFTVSGIILLFFILSRPVEKK